MKIFGFLFVFILTATNSQAISMAMGRDIKCSGQGYSAQVKFSISVADGMELKSASIVGHGLTVEQNFISNEYFSPVPGLEDYGTRSISYPTEFEAFSYGALVRLTVEPYDVGTEKTGHLLIIANPSAGKVVTQNIPMTCLVLESWD